jgi:hypothetical protein
MKKLTGLNEKVSPISDDDPRAGDIMPTFRRIYRMAIGNSLAKSGDEAIDLFQLGLKLRQEENEISLEDAEFRLLKESLARNAGQLVAHIQGQALLRLKTAEEAKG